MSHTQTVILEKLSEMFEYMQSPNRSSSSGSVSPLSSSMPPTPDLNALPHSSIGDTTSILTSSLLPTRFGSNLPNVEESSPTDHATLPNGDESNYGMDPTYSILSTLPTDCFWPPYRQEGKSEEVANGLADASEQNRNCSGPHKRKGTPSPGEQPAIKKRRVPSGQFWSDVAVTDTTPHYSPPSMEVEVIHTPFFIPSTADVNHAGFYLHPYTSDLTGIKPFVQTTNNTSSLSNSYISLDHYT